MLQTIEEVVAFFKQRDQFGIKPGLDRIHILLEKLDHPEENIKAVHVSGTNGKGSTIQFLQEALRYNDYRVGVFTSPSFTGINGHFLINGEESTDDEIIALVNQLLPHVEQLDQLNEAPTTFEIITVMAFVYFQERVDIALVETGMGGRFDTTNCFVPKVAVITNVAIDHTQFLGKSLPEIAWHKAGIIKKNRPVVIGRMDKGSLKVVEDASNEKQASMYQLGKDFHYTVEQEQSLHWTFQPVTSLSCQLRMLGLHQKDNAAVALMTLFLLQKQGLALQKEKVVKGIESAVLPGRFEKVSDYPVIILDSAHNIAGTEAFIKTLEASYPNQDRHLVFAGFKDKQLRGMLELLETHFQEITLTSFDHERAANVEALNEIPLSSKSNIVEAWEQVVEEILQQDSAEESVYCITGSLAFITKVRHYLKYEKSLNL